VDGKLCRYEGWNDGTKVGCNGVQRGITGAASSAWLDRGGLSTGSDGYCFRS
jgi:hypothetical protein